MEDFVVQAQDRQKNAYAKSMSAAFQNWVQQLQADQVSFESQRIMCLFWIENGDGNNSKMISIRFISFQNETNLIYSS